MARGAEDAASDPRISGLGRIAERALEGGRLRDLFSAAAAILGESFTFDRVSVYEVSLVHGSAYGLCEWLNPDVEDAAPTRAIYPLHLFGEAISALLRGRSVESLAATPNPLLGRDSHVLLHEQMGIRWLYWCPFAVTEAGLHVVVVNRVVARPDEAWEVFAAGVDRVAQMLERAMERARQQERSERALTVALDASERYRTLYDHTPSMFFTVAEGGAVTSLNRFAEEHLGYGRSELVGRSVLDLVHPTDRDRVASQLAACFERPDTVQHLEFRKVRRAGGTLWVKETVRVSGTPPEALVVCEDITDRRTTEAALHQAQRLESLGVLASGIAHDFNNLLSAILGNTDLALLKLPPDAPARPPLERAAKAGVRAAELVRGLLVYAGKAPHRSEVVDLGQIVSETADQLSVSVGDTATLALDLAPTPPVHVDPTQLRQVLMNLVVNATEAIDAAGHGRGKIVVRTRAAAGMVRLEVIDDGIGMDVETQARMFDPFFSTKFTGRGLGLAAVAGIIRTHGGKISVESTLTRGTTFAIDLPAVTAPPDPPNVQRAARRSSSGATVLVVDDDDMVRSVLADLLRAHGFEPVVANGGAEAMIQLDRHPHVAAVILDLSMPEGGGVPVLRDLRSRSPSLPVLLTSGLAESDARERLTAGAMNEAIDAFLPKPFSPAILVEVLEQAISRRGDR